MPEPRWKKRVVYMKQWVANHRDRENTRIQTWRHKNADRLRKKSREYYQANRDRIREYQRWYDKRRQYNLTQEQFESKLALQDGKCFLCGEPPKPGKVLAVDHDHKTGQIRALLCNKCNLTLGYVQDNTELLSKMVQYLDSYRKDNNSGKV